MLKTRCKKFDEETLEMVMASLQRQSKAVLFITPDGEKVVVYDHEFSVLFAGLNFA